MFLNYKLWTYCIENDASLNFLCVRIHTINVYKKKALFFDFRFW